MTDDPIERLRAHVERHKHRTGLYVSTEGLQALLTQRDALKEQIDRMLAHRAKVISDVLVAAKHQGEDQ